MLPDSYKVALLDASVFRYDFSPELQTVLGQMKIYTAATFESELKELRTMLFGTYSRSLEDNLAFLGSQKIQTLYASEKDSGLNDDIWGLITFFSGQENSDRLVLISASRLLRQRIILAELKIDVYDPAEGRLYRAADYGNLREAVEYSKKKTVLRRHDGIANQGDILFRKNAGPVRLSDQLRLGGEAALNRIESSERLLAKVFLPGKLTDGKYRNITMLSGINEEMGISWAEFPRDLLFYDEGCTVPAGFLEAYVHTDYGLCDDNLYLGNMIETFAAEDSRTIGDTIRFCLRVVRQVCFLNHFGLYVSDFNWENFAVDYNLPDAVQMWDTDSFGFDNYFSGMCANELLTIRPYDLSRKGEVIGFCNEALCFFVFSLFSLGDSPLFGDQDERVFKYDNPDYEQLFKKECFPPCLWEYLEDVYRGVRAASPEMLLMVLERALQTPFANRPWRDVLMEILELSQSDVEELLREHASVEENPLPNVPDQQTTTIAGKKALQDQENVKKQKRKKKKKQTANQPSGQILPNGNGMATPVIAQQQMLRQQQLAEQEARAQKHQKMVNLQKNILLILIFLILLCISVLVCTLVFRAKGILTVLPCGKGIPIPRIAGTVFELCRPPAVM